MVPVALELDEILTITLLSKRSLSSSDRYAGVAFGLAIGNFGLGIALGLAIGASMSSSQKKKNIAADK